eukprot:3626800-Amphidinium_carterae.1
MAMNAEVPVDPTDGIRVQGGTAATRMPLRTSQEAIALLCSGVLASACHVQYPQSATLCIITRPIADSPALASDCPCTQPSANATSKVQVANICSRGS